MTATAPAAPFADQVVRRVRKNQTEEIRITVGEFNGRAVASIRVYWRADDGQWFPSRKGLTFRREMLGELIEGLVAAEMAGGGPQ